jgi:hypothetical protein
MGLDCRDNGDCRAHQDQYVLVIANRRNAWRDGFADDQLGAITARPWTDRVFFFGELLEKLRSNDLN